VRSNCALLVVTETTLGLHDAEPHVVCEFGDAHRFHKVGTRRRVPLSVYERLHFFFGWEEQAA